MLGCSPSKSIISAEDADAIEAGLSAIYREIQAGDFEWKIADEDVHMAIERVLTERIGPAGARLHTGRSRNDQVATDTRLYAKRRAVDLAYRVQCVRRALVKLAEDHFDVVLPGYTHLQRAQPVLFSHHMLAYAWMLTRDFTRVRHAHEAADVLVLGSAALAGTTFDLDRAYVAGRLGFSAVSENSMDSVSDRDFLLDLVYACAVIQVHLSRLAEELVVWSSGEFGFVTIADDFATGSSIMPQKKNPDLAELVRGKTGRVVGDLTALLVTLKALPARVQQGHAGGQGGGVRRHRYRRRLAACDEWHARHAADQPGSDARGRTRRLHGRHRSGRLPCWQGRAVPRGARGGRTAGARGRDLGSDTAGDDRRAVRGRRLPDSGPTCSTRSTSTRWSRDARRRAEPGTKRSARNWPRR